MRCAGCDGGQHTVDQHTAAGCCAGRMPRIADACSSCGLDTEKCGRRCSSTDAVSGQDGLAAILRRCAARRYRRYGGFVVVVVVFSSADGCVSTTCDSSAAEKNLSPTPLHYPLATSHARHSQQDVSVLRAPALQRRVPVLFGVGTVGWPQRRPCQRTAA